MRPSFFISVYQSTTEDEDKRGAIFYNLSLGTFNCGALVIPPQSTWNLTTSGTARATDNLIVTVKQNISIDTLV